MTEKTKKICPILSITSGTTRLCMKDRCEWYHEATDECVIKTIALELYNMNQYGVITRTRDEL